MKKKDFEDIYAASFADSARWRRWFVDEVVGDADDDVVLVDDASGHPSASALVKPYDFLYSGSVLRSGYISCVAARPEARTRGLASAAVVEALHLAREHGYAFCQLIPATRSLYYFYSRFGFADAFYVDEERYTSLHQFAGGEGVPVEPTYELFAQLERRVGDGVLHSAVDYKRVMHDLSFESGHSSVAVRNGDDAACLFASWDADDVHGMVAVRSLIADNDAVALEALATLRRETGSRPFSVWRPPFSGCKAYLRVRGMARIVDPKTVLGSLAAANPDLTITISLHDSVFEDNDGSYSIGGGLCSYDREISAKTDLDVDVSVLTSLLFSTSRVGNIFGLPTRRPYMSLMLDT